MQMVTIFCLVLLFMVTIEGFGCSSHCKTTTPTTTAPPTTPTTSTNTTRPTTTLADPDYALGAAAYCDIMGNRYKSWEFYQYAKIIAMGFYQCYYPDRMTNDERNAMTGCQTIAFGGQLDDPFSFYDSICVGTNAMTPNNPKVVMLNACLTTVYYWLYTESAVTDSNLLYLVDTVGSCQSEIVFPKSNVQMRH